MANLHYCKLAEDCNWCNVPFCPYEKLDDDDPGWDQMAEIEEEHSQDSDQEEGR